jgi:Putative Actinobacterial Holin-X, holin superfamily III
VRQPTLALVEGTGLASNSLMPSSELDHRDHRNEQPAELITGVISDARDLAMAEVDKLKAEAVTQVKTVGEEVKIVSVGALILTVAAIMLGTSISLGVAALGVPPWAGFGIVAVVFGVAGYVFITQRRAIAKAT